jgi:hypothetical protein
MLFPDSSPQLFSRDGDHQVFPAAGSTPLDRGLSPFALHPFAEAVGSLSTNSARLVRPFHGVKTPYPLMVWLIFSKGDY